ncbi:Protein of unknown function [Rhizobium sp. NFR07]|uniref:DUF4435 domain-containing protein n=1 Tax=Rhizobium sp. NFR07 TaxID=1566262 RepID=UPI0008F3170B|nr:DUF4435 domain-containing protein [Rhizobium sp. NFR07]SFB48138.1 Protein of unknown function [Rhizobium sp. NFR07]
MTGADHDDDDAYVEVLKRARKSPAVLKIRLAKLRSNFPDMLVFAFEGDDDKSVFFQWIRRIRPELEYEPFPCRGKQQVIRLKKMLDQDLGGLGHGVYYFVDRDFDDLPADQVGDPTIFVTDKFSVENYLVTEKVLNETLKNEFHCNAAPEARARVADLFKKTYSEFLDITGEVNKRIFIGVRAKKKFAAHFPDSLTSLANVQLLQVLPTQISAASIVLYEEEPSPEETEEHGAAFLQLSPPDRYRGKFATMYFSKWLMCLAAERVDNDSALFKEAEQNKPAKVGELNLGNLASKSALPVGLAEFIQAVNPDFMAA